jgi:hypothetical protein
MTRNIVETFKQANETGGHFTPRVTGVSHGDSASSDLQASYQYDNTSNPTNVTVTARDSPPSRVIVIPLNGLAFIPIESAGNCSRTIDWILRTIPIKSAKNHY